MFEGYLALSSMGLLKQELEVKGPAPSAAPRGAEGEEREEREEGSRPRQSVRARRLPGVLVLALGRCSEQPGFAFVLESEALAVDVDDSGVMKDSIEHRRGEHAVVGESAIPTAEG